MRDSDREIKETPGIRPKSEETLLSFRTLRSLPRELTAARLFSSSDPRIGIARARSWNSKPQSSGEGGPLAASTARAELSHISTASAEVSVALLDRDHHAVWDHFVEKHELGSPFHLTAWKEVIEETFGYRPHYLLARRGRAVTGVLPLFVIRNPLAGTILLSSPFAVYGGSLVADEESRAALTRNLVSLANSERAAYVELRNRDERQRLGFTPVSRYVTFTQRVAPDETAILEAIPRKTRAAVRKSLKAGLETTILHHPSKAFNALYCRNLRRLGTPSFPDSYFDSLFRHFQGAIDVREVRREGRTVSAVLSLYFRDQILPYYGASDPEFSALSPNNFMYYDLMRWGGAHGYRVFDFGRSKKCASGSYDFKAHWGMLETDLPYEILLVRRKSLPNYSPANPKFDLPMRLWRKVPLWITRAIGPRLIRLFP